MSSAAETGSTGAAPQESQLEQLEADAKRLCTGINDELARVRHAQEATAAQHRTAQEDLANERSKLDEEKAQMEGVHKFQGSRVQLDVGGHAYTASRETLCKVEGSMLESMFSGRHALISEGGSYFIDRDGTHFRYILNYLRTGSVTSPADPTAKNELAVEADYYCLSALATALRAPALDLLALLGPELLQMREEESVLRKSFFTGTAGHLDAHHGLVDVFGEDSAASLTFSPVLQCFPAVAVLRPASEGGKRVVVASLDAFRTNFNRLYANVLNRLTPVLAEEPVFIAGGAVLRALTDSEDLRANGWWGESGDVDLFLCCADASEGCRVANRIFDAMVVDGEHWFVNRGRGVLNLQRFEVEDPPVSVAQTIQVVLRLYSSPAEVLAGFDVDCCCAGYDGTSVWALPRCLRALSSGSNVVNPLHAWPNRPTYEMRLGKYAARGYAISVPALDQHRVDHALIRRSQLSDLHGMARLLKVAYELEAAPTACRSIRGRNLPPDNATRLEGLQRVRFPQQCGPLKECYEESLSEEQKLAQLRLPGGATNPVSRGSLPNHANKDMSYARAPFFVPSIYGYFTPQEYQLLDSTANRFPLTAEERAAVWREILDTGVPDEALPQLMLDSWDNGKRSREYLNSDNDAVTLNAQYYCHAYVK